MTTSTKTVTGNSSSSNVVKALGQLGSRAAAEGHARHGTPVLNVTPRFVESRLKQFASR